MRLPRLQIRQCSSEWLAMTLRLEITEGYKIFRHDYMWGRLNWNDK